MCFVFSLLENISLEAWFRRRFSRFLANCISREMQVIIYINEDGVYILGVMVYMSHDIIGYKLAHYCLSEHEISHPEFYDNCFCFPNFVGLQKVYVLSYLYAIHNCILILDFETSAV